MADAAAPDERSPDTTHEDAARQTFAWLASHALASAIHAVSAPLELLCAERPGEALSPRQRELIEIANGGVTRLTQLSDELRLLTHVAEQTTQVSLERVPLTRLLREAIARAQAPLVPDPPRAITSHAPPGLAFCDPTLARRALAAVIENALRFSPPPMPVTVEARKQRNRAIIRVHDSGPGVAPADAERIFEPLYVGSPPLMPVGVGLGIGLGLAVARACAEAQGGCLRLEPGDGTGATFTLELQFAGASTRPSG
jgi:signal transduction histidine kinase